ncbi:MAG: agmatine deiminase family protein [Patescibacteria group bacterium]
MAILNSAALFTIAEMKYRMPGEWEPHEATWIAWPHNKEHWPGKFEPIPLVYVEIVRALGSSEPVCICVNDDAEAREAKSLLAENNVSLDNISFYTIPTNASWSRDHGPTFVQGERGVVALDWQYNANGMKWGPYDKDDAVPPQVAQLLNVPVMKPGMVLEGGSIDVNGVGSLLTTEQCLLNVNRNPSLKREDIEQRLKEYLGVRNILWLKGGIEGDDTDGHVDDVARFVNATTVVCPRTEDTSDVDYEILERNFADLSAMRDQDGNALTLVPLPTPSPVVYEETRLPASYMNFYIANKAVLVPTFRCPQDAEARSIFEKLFPTRRIIGIDCTDLVWGFGTIHCSTQQQPSLKALNS